MEGDPNRKIERVKSIFDDSDDSDENMEPTKESVSNLIEDMQSSNDSCFQQCESNETVDEKVLQKDISDTLECEGNDYKSSSELEKSTFQLLEKDSNSASLLKGSSPTFLEKVSDCISPKETSNPASPGRDSNPAFLEVDSNHSFPEKDSNTAFPQKYSNPTSPEKESNPSSPEKNSNPATPGNDFNPASPEKDSNPASPEKDSNPASPKKDSNPASPEKDSNPASPNDPPIFDSPEPQLSHFESSEGSQRSPSPSKAAINIKNLATSPTSSHQSESELSGNEFDFEFQEHESDDHTGETKFSKRQTFAPHPRSHEGTSDPGSQEPQSGANSRMQIHVSNPESHENDSNNKKQDTITSSMEPNSDSVSSEHYSFSKLKDKEPVPKPQREDSISECQKQDSVLEHEENIQFDLQKEKTSVSKSEFEQTDTNKINFTDSYETSADFSGFEPTSSSISPNKSTVFSKKMPDYKALNTMDESVDVVNDLTLSSDESEADNLNTEHESSDSDDERGGSFADNPNLAKKESTESNNEEIYDEHKSSSLGNETTIDLSSLVPLDKGPSYEKSSSSSPSSSSSSSDEEEENIVPSASIVSNGGSAGGLKLKVRVEDIFTDSEEDEVEESSTSFKPIPQELPHRPQSSASPGNGPLMEAFKRGWIREVVPRKGAPGPNKADIYYITPCHKKLRSSVEVQNYLNQNDIGHLSVENFNFTGRILGLDPKYEIVRESVSKPMARNAKKKTGRPVPIHSSTPVSRKRPSIISPSVGKRPPKVARKDAKEAPNQQVIPKASIARPSPFRVTSSMALKPSIDSTTEFFKLPSMAPTFIFTPRKPDVDDQKTYHCTPSCPLGMGAVPNLQCIKCCCLFHQQCVNMPEQIAYAIILQPLNQFFCPNCYRENSQQKYSGSFEVPDHYEPLSWDPSDEEDDESVYPFMGDMKPVFETIHEEEEYRKSLLGHKILGDSKPVTIKEEHKKISLPPVDFLEDFGRKMKAIRLILSYLPLTDLLKCSQVSSLFRDLAYHPDLWKNVKLSNVRVVDWKKMAKFLRKRETKTIDLCGMDIHESLKLEVLQSSMDLKEETLKEDVHSNPEETSKMVPEDINDNPSSCPKSLEDATSIASNSWDAAHPPASILNEHAYSGLSSKATASDGSPDDVEMKDASPLNRENSKSPSNRGHTTDSPYEINTPMDLVESVAEVVIQDSSAPDCKESQMEILSDEEVNSEIKIAPHRVTPPRDGELPVWHMIFESISEMDSLRSVIMGTSNPVHLEILLFYCKQLESITNSFIQNKEDERSFDPSYLMNSPSLKSLVLQSPNSFSMKSNFNFIKLPNLKHLVLNGFKAPLHGWPYLGTSLTSLSLSPVKSFNESTWNNLGLMKDLDELELGGGLPHQDQEIAATLSKMTNVRKLSLFDWHLGPKLMTAVKKTTNITHLSINMAPEFKGMEGSNAKRIQTVKETCKHLVSFSYGSS